MAPIGLILVKGLVALNGAKEFFDHYLHLEHHHHCLSDSGHHVPVHDTVFHNCTDLGVVKSECWSTTAGIPRLQTTPSMPGLVRNPDVAGKKPSKSAGSSFSLSSSAPKSTDSAVNKIQSRGHSDDDSEEEAQVPWILFALVLVAFQILICIVLVLCSLSCEAFAVSSWVKQKLREHLGRRKVEKAKKWDMLRQHATRLNNTPNPPRAARSISNVDFFTTSEDMGIGSASAPRNGVADDEDVERGRPQERFWICDPRNPRPGLASTSTAVGTHRSDRTSGMRHGSRDSLVLDESDIVDGRPAIGSVEDHAHFQSIYP